MSTKLKPAALSKLHPPGSSTPLGIRPAPDQDPAARRQVMHVDRATKRAAGGSEVGSFNLDLINRTVACAGPNLDPDNPDAGGQAVQTSEAVIAAMRAFKPTDEIEAMLSAQAVMLHHMAMEAGRRAMRSSQPPDVASKLRKDAVNACRGMADMVEALARHRGQGSQQLVRVERVTVGPGGQAVVGVVSPGTSALSSPPPQQAIAQGDAPIATGDATPVVTADRGREG